MNLLLPPGGGLLFEVRMTNPKPSLSLRWSVISNDSWSLTLGTWIRGSRGEPFTSVIAPLPTSTEASIEQKITRNDL